MCAGEVTTELEQCEEAAVSPGPPHQCLLGAQG